MRGPGRPHDDSELALDDLVALGRITRPHGISGAVRVLPYCDPPEEFEKLREGRVVLSWDRPQGAPGKRTRCSSHGSAQVVHIADYFFHKQFVVIRLKEIESISDAESLRGAELLVPPESLWAPDEGTFFVHELVGFDVVDSESGERIGSIVGIDPGAAQDFIRVRNDRAEFLVPFAKAIVLNVSTTEKRMYVSLPPGLDEL